MEKRTLMLFAACVMLAAMATPSMAQVWESFQLGNCQGLTTTPTFASGTTSYMTTLSQGATINGQPIKFVQAVYALGKNQNNTFTAPPGTSSSGWVFSKSEVGASGQFAGYRGTTANQLNTPTAAGGTATTSFTFASFNVPQGTTVIPGYLLGFGQNQTGFFKCETGPTPPPAIPELPTSALAGLGGMFAAGVSLLRRRLNRV